MHGDRCNRHLNSMYLSHTVVIGQETSTLSMCILRRQRVIKDAIAKRLHSGVHKSLLTADPGLKMYCIIRNKWTTLIVCLHGFAT